VQLIEGHAWFRQVVEHMEQAGNACGLARHDASDVAGTGGDDGSGGYAARWWPVLSGADAQRARELAAAMKKEHATSGSVLVVDPTDGSIRALASAPTYDPAPVPGAAQDAVGVRLLLGCVHW